MRQRYLVNFRWVPKLWLTLDFWLQSANKSVLLAPIEFELGNGSCIRRHPQNTDSGSTDFRTGLSKPVAELCKSNISSVAMI